MTSVQPIRLQMRALAVLPDAPCAAATIIPTYSCLKYFSATVVTPSRFLLPYVVPHSIPYKAVMISMNALATVDE
jgi:hypothetical protein